ncbi:MAG: DUF86 domain-containing protein [Muribaculaceae bacterium]|nr:DUF86 domain-containing protein [Muribaculaceae bacterium]MDE6643859.1 DUF86 domain-containing protein [Muribaculaceae bacterium]
MESQSLDNIQLISHIVTQMIEACDLISSWNENVISIDDYLTSLDGMQKMAASCMLIESIGEGVKKIERLFPELLYDKFPTTPWKEIMGLRNHIAHGYFNLDADIILDVVKNEIPPLKNTLEEMLSALQ